MKRINPKQMAELYFSMLKGRAAREVDTWINLLKDAPESQHYWLVVRSFLAEHRRDTRGKH